jgi:hypothetical protein
LEWTLTQFPILKGKGNNFTDKEKNLSNRRKNYKHKKDKSKRNDKITLDWFKKNKGSKGKEPRSKEGYKIKNSKANN